MTGRQDLDDPRASLLMPTDPGAYHQATSRCCVLLGHVCMKHRISMPMMKDAGFTCSRIDPSTQAMMLISLATSEMVMPEILSSARSSDEDPPASNSLRCRKLLSSGKVKVQLLPRPAGSCKRVGLFAYRAQATHHQRRNGSQSRGDIPQFREGWQTKCSTLGITLVVPAGSTMEVHVDPCVVGVSMAPDWMMINKAISTLLWSRPRGLSIGRCKH
nr:hypothetical protein CFP56_70513 [Quercus suber]